MLTVRLFGRLAVLWNNQTLPGLQVGKACELFCFLLVHHDKPQPRELLANQFWSERSTSQSRKNLRHTLWQLQNLLISQAEGSSQTILSIEPDWVQLNSNSGLWVDLHEFKKGYHQMQAQAGQTMNAQQYQHAKDVAQLYQGSLLTGWYQDWCLVEREQYENAYLEILDRLMSYAEIHQKYSEGLSFGENILRIERARERTYRQLMRLHYLAGDRTAALRQYERCMTVLQEELSTEPSHLTVSLYRQLLDDCLDENSSSLDAMSHHNQPKDQHTAETTEILERLYEFRRLLTQVQDFIYEDILRLEKRINDRA
jgi:DNA-binding SARP family transcriptional activator